MSGLNIARFTVTLPGKLLELLGLIMGFEPAGELAGFVGSLGVGGQGDVSA